MNTEQSTIAVALSGGADSLYSLVNLMEQGHSVFGLHGIFLTPESAREEEEAASMRERLAAVCVDLGLPLHLVDLREQFERLVIRPFVEAYARGLTPNPCAHCNASVKFGLLQDEAIRLGANRLATGHYAALSSRVEPGQHFPALFAGSDAAKDQSYFLGLVPGRRLARAMFPLALTQKKDVLKSLARLGIPPPQSGESQDVCFIHNGDYRDLVPRLARRFGIRLPEQGPMLLPDGKRLATHQGLWRYTEGQRKGLGFGWKEPLYVLGKENADNVLRIGPKQDLRAAGCECAAVNSLLPYEIWPEKVLVKTRYRERPRDATAQPAAGGGLRLMFTGADNAVAAGQIAVVYLPASNGRLQLVAGAIITRGL